MVLAQDWELLTILKKLMACGCAQPAPPLHTFALGLDGLFCVKLHFDQIAHPASPFVPAIYIVLDRGAWFCAGNELVQSTREAIFGTTTNAALRLTEDAEDWMRFLRFAIAFHLEAETRRAEEEPEPLKVRRSFGLLSLSL